MFFSSCTPKPCAPILEQAALASPIFQTRWRWDATRALALLRFQGGKKVPPQIQRMRSDDLLASVFPDVAACFENIEGDIKIPDHPLVHEVMKDVLTEAMDIEGLGDVLRGIEQGRIRCLAVDTPVPSQFSHEILNANPYAYLDDAPLEERRARAVEMRRVLPASVLEEVGRARSGGDRAGAAAKRGRMCAMRMNCMMCCIRWWESALSCQRSALSSQLSALRKTSCSAQTVGSGFFERLQLENRAIVAEVAGRRYWVAAERVEWFRAMHLCRGTPSSGSPNHIERLTFDDAVLTAVQGWMAHLGPTTAAEIGELLGLAPAEIEKALLRIEATGAILRGKLPARSQPSFARPGRAGMPVPTRVVRAAVAGAHPSADGRDIAQADRAGHGVAVHELALALAASRSGDAGARGAWHAGSDSSIAGV